MISRTPQDFTPQIGDHVEFLSDRQTEKGPSGGRVVIVEGSKVAIRHSDAVEWFDARKIRVVRFNPWNKHLVRPSRDWSLA